ncbi:YrpD family protein [Bacillus swezeyi]|uniref:YrpD family protein n=1 Tax=Bacillus swezeyi TaxID=1925020 RepID=UPI000F7680C9|nr:YrpD family protein [Bacillus swezeyi]MEC1260645.1 YrpD family protein [Bacillus swezeyi]MED2928404.1 YrpD family protein [Bacillus swezeyi]MED2942569.1 YrpD family protein [Bacillus swezeyi]MED2964031.1 YrpD family protein [Bacillus swezeyi]MED3074096.1 YrpD family protein [Bacillus swezeyi]
MLKKWLMASAVGTAVLFTTFSGGIPGLPSTDAQVAKAASQLPNGIGGRAYLNSTGSVFTAKIKLPDTIQIENATAYIYSGFRAKNGTESDIGLQYSTVYKVWKPLMKVGSKNEETYIEGKEQFTNHKGFRPGSTVQMTIYKNLNGNTRATFWGTNNDGYTGRIIMEIQGTNIGTLLKWKTLATAAVSSESQRSSITAGFSTSFTNITIDQKAVTPVVDTQDFAKVIPSGNNVTISVKK